MRRHATEGLTPPHDILMQANFHYIGKHRSMLNLEIVCVCVNVFLVLCDVWSCYGVQDTCVMSIWCVCEGCLHCL